MPVTFRPKMPRKSTAGCGRKRSGEGRDESSPPVNVAKTEKDVVQWRPARVDTAPWELTGETILFAPFVERGLALPTSDFFCGILGFYKIKLYYLTPNPVLHMSIFVHLYEAFLGIRPHFHLFRHLFRFKPQPDVGNPTLVGGAGLQLRNKEVYLEYTTPTSLSG
ncbi:putative gypsy-type retrotransposon protein [Panicum miliaceum]|uniref:Gypsy-type retrotransposon protein n=1 Tax=Panicum miliaceum TaxID=4540 RepID=A0A3L6RTP0_PANMI|nr:putative gypsy-type retrotransposon protein [Panicum miliaceum]